MGKRPDNSRRPARKAKIIQLKTRRPQEAASSDDIKSVASRPLSVHKNQKTSKLDEQDLAMAVSATRVDEADSITSQKARIIEMPGDKKSLRESKKEAKRKAKRKAKAEKKYAKTYGTDSSFGSSTASKKNVSQGGSEGGPRPALYKGKMGSSQKKSQKMQSRAKAKAKIKAPKVKSSKPSKAAADSIAAASAFARSIKDAAPSITLSEKNTQVFRKLAKPLITLGIIALFFISLYGPAQQYYVQMRETDRLQAEYAAVTLRNDSLQSEIDTLQTDEGIEDRAHKDLGYIRQDEKTASVKGIELKREDNFSSNVPPGSIQAPQTWYSPVLDILFGYVG